MPADDDEHPYVPLQRVFADREPVAAKPQRPGSSRTTAVLVIASMPLIVAVAIVLSLAALGYSTWYLIQLFALLGAFASGLFGISDQYLIRERELPNRVMPVLAFLIPVVYLALRVRRNPRDAWLPNPTIGIYVLSVASGVVLVIMALILNLKRFELLGY